MSFCYFCEKLDFVWEIKNPKSSVCCWLLCVCFHAKQWHSVILFFVCKMVCNLQIDDEDAEKRYPLKRSPLALPVVTMVENGQLHCYAESGTIASLRISKIDDDSVSATYVTSGRQYEVFPLPASWREGDYVIVVTIGDRHYRETFSL